MVPVLPVLVVLTAKGIWLASTRSVAFSVAAPQLQTFLLREARLAPAQPVFHTLAKVELFRRSFL